MNLTIKHFFQLLIAAFRLSRFPNLLIIAITQYLVAYCLVSEHGNLLLDGRFFAMVVSTMIIAASGYFINDYYDIKIDLINKPDKVIIDKQLKRRYVMAAHIFLNSVGIIVGIWVHYLIGLVNAWAVLMLWWYSNALKRTPFVGNFTVALMTASTILMINLYFKSNGMLVNAYAFFAFAINLIREIIKDIEDQKGDETFGARSLPVVFGVRKTKVVIYTLLLLYTIILIWFILQIPNAWFKFYFWCIGSHVGCLSHFHLSSRYKKPIHEFE